jgi:AcrR family transcriptional regulator
MTRRYELKQRAQRQADTRRRIIEATVALHSERGPAATQITDIAQRAGVDRVTVYRHFPDLGSLLGACAVHYYRATIEDQEARLRHGLGELYAYWANNAATVAHILRDAQVLGHLGVGRRLLGLQRDATEVLTDAWPLDDQRRPTLAAAIRVGVDFHTWQTLTGDQGLSQQAAVELAASWTRCLPSPQ